jgi:hypothetical protein
MPRRNAFTLIQILIVLALLLFLLAFLIPAVARVREAAARTQSFNNLKQMVLGCHSFFDVHKHLPPTVGVVGAGYFGTVHYHLLPFVDMGDLYEKSARAVWLVNGQRVSIFLNPRDLSGGPNNKFEDMLATANYAANWLVFKTGENGLLVPDGTANTLMFAERYQICNGTPTAWGYPALTTWAPMFGYYSHGKFQAAPTQADCDPTLPQSIRPDAIQVAMVDGSSRYVSSSISPETWWYVTDPADGNVLGNDWRQD